MDIHEDTSTWTDEDKQIGDVLMGVSDDDRDTDDDQPLSRDEQADAIAEALGAVNDDDAPEGFDDDGYQPDTGNSRTSEEPPVQSPQFVPEEQLNAYQAELENAAQNLTYDLKNGLITQQQFHAAAQQLMAHESQLREQRLVNGELREKDKAAAQKVINECQTFYPSYTGPGCELHERAINIAEAAGYTRDDIERTRDPRAMRLLLDLVELKHAERDRALKAKVRRARKGKAGKTNGARRPVREKTLSHDRDKQVDEIAKVLLGG